MRIKKELLFLSFYFSNILPSFLPFSSTFFPFISQTSMFCSISCFPFISVKMNCTTLISGIRKDFWNSFKHAEVLVANDQSNTSKPAFLQPYEERTPAFTIFLHPFSGTKDLPAAILADANGNKNRNILDFAAPAAFQVNAIYVNIRIASRKRTGTPGFDMFISL